MKRDFANQCNNFQKINPTIYATLKEYEIKGKIILYAYIPESSNAHRTAGKYFDRNEDGDYELKNNSLIESLYLRKQSEFTENRIYPYATMEDLRLDLIDRVKQMAMNNNRLKGKGEHPWANMTPEEMLKSMQLYEKDYTTGKWGLTLGAILLFGKDSTILSILSFHRTDALYRVHDIDRYDDRDLITTNLIESYDRLMAFIAKHLDDRFYLEGDQRIDLRGIIGREICVNLLIHREFVEPFYSRLIIEKDVIKTENANRARMIGDIIQEKDFTPKPKNPKIAMVFGEIGLADELGSGMKKLIKYTKAYSGGIPKLYEGDIFRTEIPLKRENEQLNVGNDVGDDVGDVGYKITEMQVKILDEIQKNPEIKQIQLANQLNTTTKTIERNMQNMKENNIIERIGNKKREYWKILKYIIYKSFTF